LCGGGPNATPPGGCLSIALIVFVLVRLVTGGVASFDCFDGFDVLVGVLWLHELRQLVLLIVVFFDVVEVIHPTGELGRNGPFRRAFLLLIRLLGSLALGRGRRTEVASAATGSGAFAWAARARSAKPTGTWAAESATASWPWPAKAAASRARCAEASAAARSAGTGRVAAWARSSGATRTSGWSSGPTVITCTRFADGERATHEELTVELTNRGFGGFAIGVFNKRKATSAARFAIERSHDLRGLTDLREVQTQVFFAGLVRKIPYEKSNWWHG
jgi:hypothetical protein